MAELRARHVGSPGEAPQGGYAAGQGLPICEEYSEQAGNGLESLQGKGFAGYGELNLGPFAIQVN